MVFQNVTSYSGSECRKNVILQLSTSRIFGFKAILWWLYATGWYKAYVGIFVFEFAADEK
jgi:hypothetical protein